MLHLNKVVVLIMRIQKQRIRLIRSKAKHQRAKQCMPLIADELQAPSMRVMETDGRVGVNVCKANT
jgi:hypothetical protein